MKPRPSTIKTLRHRLSRPLPNPKGDKLRATIAAIPPDEDQLRWLPTSEATPAIAEAIQKMVPPPWGINTVKVTVLDESRVLLVQWTDGSPGVPIRFFIVSHPDES